MNLFVIIPAFNEEKTIGGVINSIPKKIQGIDEITILVINDGSTDKTIQVATKAGAEVFTFPNNRGVGTAFTSGANLALKKGADLVVTIDADGQFNPSHIPQLIAPIIENQADFVTCSRFKDQTLIPQMSKIKIWGNRQMANFISYLVGRRFHDVSCGFRAYSREALLHLNLFGKFTYTQESFIDLVFKGMRVLEVPLKVRGHREFGKSHISSNLFAYAYKSLKIILRTIRDYKPLKFFGLISLVIFIVGMTFGSISMYHWIAAKTISPYRSYAFIGAFLVSISFIVLVLALVADMLDRIRFNQERLLYYQKKREHEKAKDLVYNRH